MAIGKARQRVIPRPGFAASEGNSAREAAPRIELRAPASPARRGVAVRFERAVGVGRASGRTVRPCPPGSRARARWARAARVLFRAAPRPRLAGPAPVRWRRAAARPRGWRSRGTSAARRLRCQRRAAREAAFRIEPRVLRRLLPARFPAARATIRTRSRGPATMPALFAAAHAGVSPGPEQVRRLRAQPRLRECRAVREAISFWKVTQLSCRHHEDAPR
jgi:hypothetical protein